ASTNLVWERARWPWDFAFSEFLRVEDMGDVAFASGDPRSMLDNLAGHARRILAAGKTMLTLGGDHFVTLPLLRAHAEKHGPLALIHFDAHTDDYEEGGPYDHGIMMREAGREGAVDPRGSVQVGIRTEYRPETHPFAVLDAAWCNDRAPAEIADRIRKIVGARKAYLTLDIDCLDPAFAPGTGTPVVGGLSTDVLLKVLRGLVGIDLVGMDLVEVAPPYDHADITALAGATLVLELLYVLAARRRGANTGCGKRP
ncbi:MAG: agmatinase, partial [Actinobacteria bacterium]|nr:agmatinase [Actinomycetota bacterium]